MIKLIYLGTMSFIFLSPHQIHMMVGSKMYGLLTYEAQDQIQTKS
jgi:hypothetical protein